MSSKRKKEAEQQKAVEDELVGWFEDAGQDPPTLFCPLPGDSSLELVP